jgi:cobalt-zinc-cadmium efflux system outer membrane protein
MRTAFERNWDLLASAAGVDLATAQALVVREFPNPSLAASTTKIKVDNQPNSTPAGNSFWDRSYDTTFAFNQLFEIGGKRKNRRLSSDAGLEAARAQFTDARRTLDLAVTRAYVAAVQSEETFRALMQSAGTLRDEAKIAAVRLQAGDISNSDKNQIEIAAQRFEQDAQAARANAAQARVALEILLGLPHPEGRITLNDRLEALSSIEVPAAAGNSGERPDVVAAEAALRKADADLRLQKANRIPDPTALVQYEHEPTDALNTIGLGVSFPLPLWNRNRGNILAAQAAREQARLALDKTRAQAAAEISSAHISFDDASKRWREYRDSIRPKSAEIRKAVAYAYEKGGASLLDLLAAERNDNDVRLAATQAAGDTASAIASLRAATLVMPANQNTK